MEDAYTDFIQQNITCFTFDKITTKLNNKGEEKKKPIGLPKWTEIKIDNCDEFCKNTDSCIAVITGEESNLTILDFDDSDAYENLIHDHPDLKNYKTIKTKHGYHIWFKYSQSLKTTTNSMKDLDSVDIRNDGAFAYTYPSKYNLLSGETFTYEDMGGEILQLPQYLYSYFKSESKVKKNVKGKDDDSVSSLSEDSVGFDNSNFKEVPENEFDELFKKYNIDVKRLLNIIHIDYIDNRDSWTQIVWACKNIGVPKNTIIEISKKSSNFDMEGFESVYKYDYKKYSIATLKHFAKLSNETEYEKIYIFSPFKLSDRYLAEVFYDLYGENYILQDGHIYIYHKGKWIKDESCDLMKGNITEKLSKIIKQQQWIDFKKHEKDGSDAETKKSYDAQYKKCNDKINSVNGVNNVASSVKIIITMEQTSQESVFDKKPYIFAFLNTGFDVRTGKEYTIKKEDYITQCTRYNYKPYTQSQYDLIAKLMKQIFPDDEIRKSYISVLYSGLIGQQFEYFIVANGCGRNGKGVINELFYSLLGNMYAYNLSVAVLTSAINDNGGSNQSLANMELKRWVVSSEPDEHKNTRIVMSSVKKITGDQILPARGIYSKKTEILLTNTTAMECNAKLKFSGRIDQSVLNRVRDIPFVSHFTSDESLWSDENHIYPVNSYYKSNEFKKEHRIALFHYILDVVFGEILKSNQMFMKSKKMRMVLL
jgi:hypothetical protein